MQHVGRMSVVDFLPRQEAGVSSYLKVAVEPPLGQGECCNKSDSSQKKKVAHWPCNCETHTYIPLVRSSGCPVWGALIGASEGSSLGLRFRDDEPGGSEVITTTGSSRGG